MPFIKKINQDFLIKDNKIHLTSNYLNANHKHFKKITGSRFSSILGFSKYTTPLQTWAGMVGIYKETMDPILSKVGNIIEPKVRDYFIKRTKTDYKVYDPAKIKWDVFKDNKVFGGIPDGEPIDKSGNFLYPKKPMLEIKTTSIDSLVYKQIDGELRMVLGPDQMPIVKKEKGKWNQWFNEKNQIIIPNDYKLQLGLYLYLRNIENGIFAICFLETQDYKNPEDCDVNKRQIKLVELHLKPEKIIDFIKAGEKWYEDFIITGISPDITENDKIWLQEKLEKC